MVCIRTGRSCAQGARVQKAGGLDDIRNRFTASAVGSPWQDTRKPGRGAGTCRGFQARGYGWDTPLYRADYLLGRGVYQAEPVAEFEACFAAIKHDLKTCRMYLSDAEAAAELYRDPLYAGREGFFAHMALREQLIAMEVISDDL
jgi:hypothetical protein